MHDNLNTPRIIGYLYLINYIIYIALNVSNMLNRKMCLVSPHGAKVCSVLYLQA